MKNQSLEVYGIHVPRIVDVLPTNLPAIIANELRIDQLFLLADGSLAIIDYESEFRAKNLVKYAGYAIRVMERWLRDEGVLPKLRIIIIYTADVKRGTTTPDIDLDGIALHLEEGFLSDLDGNRIQEVVQNKLKQNIPLNAQEAMQLMILPLTYHDKERQKQAVEEVVTLADSIPDPESSRKILAGMLVFANRIIELEIKEKVYGRLRMTIIGQMFEEEKQAAIKKNTEEVTRTVTQTVTQTVTMNTSLRIAENLLRQGDSVEKVAECTNLPLNRVKELESSILQTT